MCVCVCVRVTAMRTIVCKLFTALDMHVIKTFSSLDMSSRQTCTAQEMHMVHKSCSHSWQHQEIKETITCTLLILTLVSFENIHAQLVHFLYTDRKNSFLTFI